MPLVINLLQPTQECRFHEPRKCEVAPIEIKAKAFTGDLKHQHWVQSQPQITKENGLY